MAEYDYEQMRRIRVDPRMVEEVRRSPRMLAEQGEGWMGGWGGPAQYQALTRLPVEERLTYAAVQEGYTDPSQIEVVTGLTGREVSMGLAGLRRKSLLREEVVEPVSM